MIKRVPLLSVLVLALAGHAGHNSLEFSTAHLQQGSYAVTVTPAAGKARRANLKL
jgi:hypothetical protein